MASETPRTDLHVHLRRLLVAGLTIYGIVCLRDPGSYRLLDAVNLGIHETGHLLFTPFGEFMHFLGGSLFQLIMPLLFVLHFYRRRDFFAAYVVTWWVAQNLWNISVYVADARSLALPLVGGGVHDWNYMLDRLGLLHLDERIAATVHFAGVLVFLWAMAQAFLHSADAAPEPLGAADLELAAEPAGGAGGDASNACTPQRVSLPAL
jgi:hypothetical protein